MEQICQIHNSHLMQHVREFRRTKLGVANVLKLVFKNNESIETKLLNGLSRHGSYDFVNAAENVIAIKAV